MCRKSTGSINVGLLGRGSHMGQVENGSSVQAAMVDKVERKSTSDTSIVLYRKMPGMASCSSRSSLTSLSKGTAQQKGFHTFPIFIALERHVFSLSHCLEVYEARGFMIVVKNFLCTWYEQSTRTNVIIDKSLIACTSVCVCVSICRMP